MTTVDNFFNKVLLEIDNKYFPEVEYYRDNVKCAKTHYITELFNNGCLNYSDYIKQLSIQCGDTTENIITIVDKYVIQ